MWYYPMKTISVCAILGLFFCGELTLADERLDIAGTYQRIVADYQRIIAQTQNAAARDAAFDAFCASIGTVLAVDRTLGGLCDWIEAEAPQPVDLPVEGAAGLKAAAILVVLHYSSADPLG